MKKLNLSLAAIFAMSTFAIAGGDIAPMEPVVEEPVVVESTGNFYLGLAYGYLSDSTDLTDNIGNISGLAPGATTTLWDESYNDLMIQAGYNFNEYIAIEGRYWFGLGDTNLYNDGTYAVDASVDAWGIYVKPQYPVTEAFNIYALLGYGAAQYDFTESYGRWTNSVLDDDSVDGFSWGLGASYAFTDNVAVFVDYVSIYNDDDNHFGTNFDINIDRTIDAWNFGVTYNF
ncbi:outer membrane protein [Sulfurovum riftiae]|uniref:Outer membrane protein beta-barrel domain-containing protein n=1 Tax=Sulfurovum riftiae TaxID=1630136 RepID=A0A151CHJ5_9BACT|nr:outer membrane beta-barrel protein [Sulfurovum riftiae]KYJ86969.1 hypothetical protein AS592_00225 [Sulfurovum riftiae]